LLRYFIFLIDAIIITLISAAVAEMKAITTVLSTILSEGRTIPIYTVYASNKKTTINAPNKKWFAFLKRGNKSLTISRRVSLLRSIGGSSPLIGVVVFEGCLAITTPRINLRPPLNGGRKYYLDVNLRG
jgi:hypothetical protein